MHMITVVALALVLQATSPRDIEFTKDSLKLVKKNVDGGKAVLIDVRSQEEWNQGYVDGAIFLPVTSLGKKPDAKKLAKVLPKKKILYTYCLVGMRAKTAAYKLEQAGYQVRALKPGYEQLIEAGFKKRVPPKDKTNSSERSAEQNVQPSEKASG